MKTNDRQWTLRIEAGRRADASVSEAPPLVFCTTTVELENLAGGSGAIARHAAARNQNVNSSHGGGCRCMHNGIDPDV